MCVALRRAPSTALFGSLGHRRDAVSVAASCNPSATGGRRGDADENREGGNGVGLLNRGATQMARRHVVFLRAFDDNKARRHRGSGCNLNTRVIVFHIGGGHRLFGEIWPVVAPFDT